MEIYMPLSMFHYLLKSIPISNCLMTIEWVVLIVYCVSKQSKFFSIIFRKIDIFIGALNENLQTRQNLSASWSYYQDSLTWCVQLKKPFPKWQNIFKLCRDWHVYLVTASGCLFVTTQFRWPISCRSFSKAWSE